MQGENERRRVHGHAADDQAPVCCSLNLNWTPLGIHVPGYGVKFDLAPVLGERKYYVIRVVCLCTYKQNGRREIVDVGNITLSMSSAPSELAKFVMILMRYNRVWKPKL